MENSPYLTTAAASEYLQRLGLKATPNTLNYWRHIGRGPAYERRGVAIIYTPVDLDAYAKSVTVRVEPEVMEAAE